MGTLPAMQAPNFEKIVYVNPSVGEDAIGAMLLQKVKGSHYMRPVYCASMVKMFAERAYRGGIAYGQCCVCLQEVQALLAG